ncbi:hypothetical protein NIES4103_36400 [Nostoc sp. NIES-4103]|nr:hypothetical protein NIES4103_36400 [Nostoc sp. NIES-4103]
MKKKGDSSDCKSWNLGIARRITRNVPVKLNGQKFMTFALRFIANDIDKIHLITNETALLCCRGEMLHSYSL